MVIDHSVFSFWNSTFKNLGAPQIIGGGLYRLTSNLTVVNSTFLNDKSYVGGAIGVQCSPASAICTTSVSNTLI